MLLIAGFFLYMYNNIIVSSCNKVGFQSCVKISPPLSFLYLFLVTGPNGTPRECNYRILFQMGHMLCIRYLNSRQCASSKILYPK